MPRSARKKSPEAVYHVMARSITEFNMFPDNTDKNRFLDLLKQCAEKYKSKVYGYSIMTTHYHILLDPNGFDVSTFMKSLNQRYVIYINKKYGRRGSLLAERFNSKIISDTEQGLIVSAYIHNNPKDIQDYADRIHEYPYSSMGIYLGTHKDKRNLVDTDFILGGINENDGAKARAAYAEMVAEVRESGIKSKLREYLEEFKKEQYEYKSYRTPLIRNKKPEELITILAKRFGYDNTNEIMHRWKQSSMRLRQAVAYTLTTFCGMGTKEACSYMKNISGTCLAKLRDKGFELFKNQPELQELLVCN